MKTIDLAGRTPAQKQGLLSQLVVPRPIAMITTLDADGAPNVAPFSYYMPVCGEPPLVAVTVGTVREATDEPKDTWVNLRESGEFVINVTTTALAEHIEVVAREYPAGVNEAEVAGWRTIPSQVVRPPSLADSPAHMECRVREVIDRGDPASCFSGVHIVLAEVVCVTVDESILEGPNHVDPTKVHAVGRMGFPWFITASSHSLFSQERIAYADLAPNPSQLRGLSS
ncbi:flavin reductase family protein [Phytohabitans rumicis]|uniref:Flavin reductase n=1 Tax=Phytohabitans rumicis TaxID=1076125 RepID=A0A6V8LNY9_9ACTN|nr:flavin reductase family protein [Phytohabitans rumicis]GFJ94435.1 flavin reductase [Phytohabitans rumicis]